LLEQRGRLRPPMRKTNAKGASLNDALDIGLIMVDADRRVSDCNAWFVDTSRQPKERLIGARLDEVFVGAVSKRLIGAISHAFEFGASSMLTHSLHPMLFPLRTRAGKPLVHDVSIKPLGVMPYQHCLIQIMDVTIAAEREAVLRERQDARYAAVVDNAPDAILTIDEDGVIQYANPAVSREFGYEPKELVGRPAAVLLRAQSEWASTWAAIKNGDAGAHAIEVVGRKKNGALAHLAISSSRWSSRARNFATVILRDISERVEAEEALRRLNETLEERVASTLAERQVLADIVEGTDAFVQVVDMDYRWLAINRASQAEFYRIFGVWPSVGQSMLDVLADKPEHKAAVKAVWARALGGESFTEIDQFGDPALERLSYEMRFNVLRDKNGEQIGAFQFVYDVTARLRDQQRLLETEEALRQSQKMEAIGQLTGGIAHDFNNLLAGIIGAMELLKRRIKAGRYEDSQRFMDAAVASANRAAALTHRLLAFARRQPLDPRPLQPNQLVISMEDLLRRTMGEQITFNTVLDDAAWLVNTDENQLENAILNLAINARDAMPEGGVLTIATANIVFDRTQRDPFGEIAAGEYVRISVKDTGTGMAPDVVAKVFDPFFTTKPIGQGTGLGLSMVYGFAQQSGGHARVESVEGAGTEIKIFMPRFSGAIETPVISGDAKELASGEGETVLLVEDDSAVRLLIGEVLRDLGYRCIEANDAFTALPMLSSNARIDLLITDVGLPKMNGRQLAEVARQHRPSLKILFVTGYAEHATGVEGFLEPGMELVTKPFTLDALALKIRDMIAPR
jgi:PAS domain S-box-containing protein